MPVVTLVGLEDLMNRMLSHSIIIHDGIPKICVPITAINEMDMKKQCDTIYQYQDVVDLIEWRADYWNGDIAQGISCLHDKLDALDKPLIFTLRSVAEGGNHTLDHETYQDWCIYASASFNFIDVEYHYISSMTNLIAQIHQAKAMVIVSHHNFKETPSYEAMMKILQSEEKANADIVKLAVMPNDLLDTKRLMDVCTSFHANSNTPIIAIAMGELGKESRINVAQTGSCITFASLEGESAPGQINAVTLRSMIHEK